MYCLLKAKVCRLAIKKQSQKWSSWFDKNHPFSLFEELYVKQVTPGQLWCTPEKIQVSRFKWAIRNRTVLVASVMSFQKIFGLHGLNQQIIEYWVSRGRYWLVLGGTGSEQGGTGCQHDELSENIWFAWSKSSNYWIFEEGKRDYGQTNPQNFLL